MTESIINQLEAALGETVQLFSSFSQVQANSVPFEGSWTAAQVCQHLYLSQAGIDKLLTTPSEPANRPSAEKADELRQVFLDYNLKMKSPDFIIPENREYDKKALIQNLKEVKDKILEAAVHANFNEIAPLPEGHPLKGHTKHEIIYFVTYHTTRHNHQLKNIAQALKV